MRTVVILVITALIACTPPDVNDDFIRSEDSDLGRDAAITMNADAAEGATPTAPEMLPTSLTGPPRVDREDIAEDLILRLPKESEPTEEIIPPMMSREGWTPVEGCEREFRVQRLEHADGHRAENHEEPPAHEYGEDPQPPFTWRWADVFPLPFAIDRDDVLADLVMPGYSDSWSVFERAREWSEPTRCYELPEGAFLLTESAAYDLWLQVVRETIWLEVDQTPGVRSVVGLRGSEPGAMIWHGNPSNRFNDTLVLLWRDEDGQPNVREFPVNTDTGAYPFSAGNSSSLYPNRHYPYINGWHGREERRYNAFSIASYGYRVRDDGNKNGHWDDDRNGWLDGGVPDYFRGGSGHNIHMAAPNQDIQEQRVHNWSAGCQVIPGMANWMEFIGHAWTGPGDQLDYFLIDARDIASSVWNPCGNEVGTHRCPEAIRTLPAVVEGNTESAVEERFDVYNCSDANEAGPEYVYVFNLREQSTLRVTVESDDPSADPDIYLLSGDESTACLTRAHEQFDWPNASPGRYLLVVDTWVNADGEALAGHYRVHIETL